MRVTPIVCALLLASIPIAHAEMKCSDLRGQHDSRAREENDVMQRHLQQQGRGNLSQSDFPPLLDDMRSCCKQHNSARLDEASKEAWRNRR